MQHIRLTMKYGFSEDVYNILINLVLFIQNAAVFLVSLYFLGKLLHLSVTSFLNKLIIYFRYLIVFLLIYVPTDDIK